MLNNPLIQRYRYSLLRPDQFSIYAVIYISVIGLIFLINAAFHQADNTPNFSTESFNSFYYQFLGFEVLILVLIAAYNSGSAIKSEVLNKSYDFFRMLPMPAYQKAIGILVGKNLVILLLAVVNLLFLIFFGVFGEVSPFLQLQVIAVLLSITILINSMALLVSINPMRKNKNSGVWGLILLLLFIGPFFLQGLFALKYISKIENYYIGFFQIKLPILLLIALIALYFACWAIKGILRKFTREQDPLFSRNGAILFMLGFEVITLGLYFPYIAKGETIINYSFWLTNFFPAILIAAFSMITFDKYLEYSGLLQNKADGRKTTILSILLYSNLLHGIGLFAIWGIASAAMTFAMKIPLQPCIYSILILFSFYLFFLMLLELYMVYSPAYSKIGLLLGFIALVLLFLPLILSAILDNEQICLYSLFGYFGGLFNKYICRDIKVETGIIAINALFCIICGLFIWKRYNYILAARKKM